MEDFVPYELAVKLKDKGFNYPCIGHYVNNQLYITHYRNAFHSDNDESVDAPTIPQVLKWLREEYQIHIFVDVTSVGWIPKVSIKVKLDDTRYWFSKAPIESDFFDTYEEAIVAGIEYCLDNLL